MSETWHESKVSITGRPQRAVSKEASLLVERQDLINIAILTAIALAIGIYLVSTTVIISKDGATYIEYAKRLAEEPLKAMRQTPEPPGYPFLIYLSHTIGGLFCKQDTIDQWIISAQVVSLLSKVIATIALYFVGRYLVGPQVSFWGVVILTVLPDFAKYGSDALSDWPHLMFLTTGFALLLSGVQFRKCWIFGYAGIVAGLGYLVRPECCQLIVYGGVWLLFNLISPRNKMRRTKATKALILLLVGFAVVAIPYMRYKGYVFPMQGIWELPPLLSMTNCIIDSGLITDVSLAGLSVRSIIGDGTLITNMCEVLMYYFVPGFLIGSHYYFRRQSKTLEQIFFATMPFVANVAMLLWQSSWLGFLSRRHTLALVAFTIFYTSVGLHIVAYWLSGRISRNNVTAQKNRQFWFIILIVVGVGICLPKLLRPIRLEKQGYKDAAQWLRANTNGNDIIAVPDKRISFYAERKGLVYDEKVPGRANYAVKIYKDEDELVADKELLGAKKILSFAGGRRGALAMIYDIRGHISEKVYCVEYHCEKISDERYKLYFVFEVTNEFAKDWLIYVHGHVKDKHIILLPEKRRKYKFDNWVSWPKPATSAWPKNERITITHEIIAKPIPYNLAIGFWTAKEGNHGRPINLGWVDLGDIKQSGGKQDKD